MTRYLSANAVIRFLQIHDWVWYTIPEICSNTGCPPDEIDELLQIPIYGNAIDKRNEKLRYIGNFTASRRRICEYLKNIYPNTASANQIRKGANINKNVGYLIRIYSDLLPIEIIGKHGYQYRYLPDDDRAIGDTCYNYSVITARKHNKTTMQEAENASIYYKIKRYLIDNEGKQLYARDIALAIDESVRSVANMMYFLRKRNRHIQYFNDGSANIYCYVRNIELQEVVV